MLPGCWRMTSLAYALRISPRLSGIFICSAQYIGSVSSVMVVKEANGNEGDREKRKGKKKSKFKIGKMEPDDILGASCAEEEDQHDCVNTHTSVIGQRLCLLSTLLQVCQDASTSYICIQVQAKQYVERLYGNLDRRGCCAGFCVLCIKIRWDQELPTIML